ncbi:DNA repair protein RAD51 homolog 2 [Octopus bimaculoides]|uniref:RecA family profile 1 domain-containing protein n=1 Tax=Octopus bimaculoides TaxID=37653 RepID=A0A0L8G6K2_OCTBM|nr:DNA repair protein RAD51 homolog 2 [Octopus bimaculoides]XP_014783612.1 DNA repair protein RAD51 homolog 2 [Octopus bimaculoides]|eukprot:XP_014783611.1 PREDICTED: DNA repair protein RAD51 homolog 2-like [Octopus bimaculoides]
MALRKIKRTSHNSDDVKRLQQQNLRTCKDVLNRSTLELFKIVGKSQSSVEALIRNVSLLCAPKPCTAAQLLEKRKLKTSTRPFFATSLPDLDKVLHGGILIGSITELAGPAGCGKTQFCMMLSLLSTLPTEMRGMAGSVIYIDTESTFSASRLVEMARNKYPDYFNDEDRLKNLTENVLVDFHSTCDSLVNRFQELEMDIISKKVKLLIVDSIASLVRKEFGGHLEYNMAERANFLTKTAALLKNISESFQIPVVVTNQITTRLATTSRDFQTCNAGNAYATVALGNTWSHSVNTRLIIEYVDSVLRQVMVAKSPIAPFTSFYYTIQSAGIVQEKDSAYHYYGTDPTVQRIRVRTDVF